jgi:hypothetical protein
MAMRFALCALRFALCDLRLAPWDFGLSAFRPAGIWAQAAAAKACSNQALTSALTSAFNEKRTV